MQKNVERFHSLDSLRGIASLQVIIAHSLVTIPGVAVIVFGDSDSKTSSFFFNLTHTILSFFWSDSSAVKVFFVLSGFVLSLSFYNSDLTFKRYFSFFIRRIVRLYLPCLAIILISLFLRYNLYTPINLHNYGAWVAQMWAKKPTSSVLINIFLLRDDLEYFDRSLWTLGPELKLSLILPFLIVLFKKIPFLFCVGIIILYAVTWHYLNKTNLIFYWKDYPVLYYFTFFLAGSLLCKYRLSVRLFIEKLPIFLFLLIIIIAIYLYTIKYSMFWLMKYRLFGQLTDYISLFAAILFIILFLDKRVYHLVVHKSLLFLGKISFSLYLVHIVIIASLIFNFKDVLNTWQVVIISFITSFFFAMGFQKFIELPALKLANYFSTIFIKKNQF